MRNKNKTHSNGRVLTLESDCRVNISEAMMDALAQMSHTEHYLKINVAVFL